MLQTRINLYESVNVAPDISLLQVSIQLSNVARMIRHAGKVRKGQPEHLPLIEELEMFLSRVEQMDLVLSFFHRYFRMFRTFWNSLHSMSFMGPWIKCSQKIPKVLKVWTHSSST